MRRRLWIIIGGAAILAVAFALLALPRGDGWSTSSTEALAEFEAAMDAQRKLYHEEERARLERALELDPDFVMPKLRLADILRKRDPERARELYEEAMAADPSRLSERERVLVRFTREVAEGNHQDANRYLDEYLELEPDDSYVLHLRALRAWGGMDFESAERLNRHLLEVEPNYVLAYNQLGYLEMQRGRFAEAEEHFKSYRFIAPDQANPHDSLGELFVITGRYDEAERSFARAIEIRPDFWDAYRHLAQVRILLSDFEGAGEVADQAESAGAPPYLVGAIRCSVRVWEPFMACSWPEVLARAEGDCGENATMAGEALVMAHMAYCALGEHERALAIEKRLAEMVSASKESAHPHNEMDGFSLVYVEAVRLAVEGDLKSATARLEKLDENLSYINSDSGIFKLYNRLLLAELLAATGRDGASERLLAEVRQVNPHIAEDVARCSLLDELRSAG